MTTNVTHAPDINRDLLHRILWRRADHLGRLRLNVRALATELHLGYCNLSTQVNVMAREGRIRTINNPKIQTQKTYVVINPEVWRA